MDNTTKNQSVTGIYTQVPNPCLTKPCLPGMVPAVKTGNQVCYLLTNGHFLPDDFIFGDYSPNQGEKVEIVGIKGTMTDIFGETFYVIELTSCLPG